MEHWLQHRDAVLIVAGLAGLFLGGELLIRGAVAIAERLRLPKLLVGLTIVGFGTSMPELLVSLKALESGAGDVAVGNVVGSNIANILLIAGLSALIRPISTRFPGIARDSVVMTLVTLGFCYMAWRGHISREEGGAMALGLLVFLLLVFMMDRKKAPAEPAATSRPMAAPLALVFVGAGLAALVFGADALVEGATAVATQFGVSQAVIGLTLVAVGTSLPELTVSLMSAVRGQNELALGNVIGSNLFNILAVLGLTAVLSPFAISPRFLEVDIPLMAGAAVGLTAVVLLRPKFGRLAGLACLTVYGVYLAWLAGAVPAVDKLMLN